MRIIIDGHAAEAGACESFRELTDRLGLSGERLSERVLAVRAGGRIVPLNCVPARTGAGLTPERDYARCLEKAGHTVASVRITDPDGAGIYFNTLVFVFMLAMKRLYPEARVHADYALGNGTVYSVLGVPALTEEDVCRIRSECTAICGEDLPLVRERVYTDDAIDEFRAQGREDAAELLGWRILPYFDLYRAGGMSDYYYGEMLPSTGYVTVFGLELMPTGRLLLLPPDPADAERPARSAERKKLDAAFRKSADWNVLMHCMTVADLNRLVRDGGMRDLIRVNEALHEKDYAGIADRVVRRGAKAVLIAGPSSSGKTTSANRLCTQLRVFGKQPIPISLDDYYIDRDKCEVAPDGKVDLEHINCLDVARFGEDLAGLIAGKEVQLPRFDFKLQRSIPDGGKKIRLGEDSLLVIEGLHGLNPAMLPAGIDREAVFKVFVSALTTLNVDSHNRLNTTALRLMRRMVRDYRTRGASVEDTFGMWDSVRRGEERWIFPFQEEADAMFNSSLVYEPVVLKRHIYPLLMAVGPADPHYGTAREMVKFLNYILEQDFEDEVPPTSVLREFIGGNVFYR
ncbi:MAG: nucleoside kinase [Clostridia bacterium]|nr:nucleoside kinase [Clostridia bacterium]